MCRPVVVSILPDHPAFLVFLPSTPNLSLFSPSLPSLFPRFIPRKIGKSRAGKGGENKAFSVRFTWPKKTIPFFLRALKKVIDGHGEKVGTWNEEIWSLTM